MRRSRDVTAFDRAGLLARTREYVERAVSVDPDAGFSLSDIGTPAQWRLVFTSAMGPDVIAEAVEGAVLALLPCATSAHHTLTALDPSKLTSPGTANTGDFDAARDWLVTDLDRATGTRQDPAAVVSDIHTMGAHRHPAHLAALVLAVVIVANHAAFKPE